jgi:hypothetical protein
MSKIDLSQAKVGDKFRDRYGRLHELIYILKGDCSFRYLLVDEQKDNVDNYKVDGSYLQHDISNLDLVEQVFDEQLDTKERDIRTNYEIKKVIEVADEEKQELHRRQEVFDLAEKMYIMFENEILRYHLNRDGSDKFCSEDLREMAIIRASSFINKKHKYLKDGKLC